MVGTSYGGGGGLGSTTTYYVYEDFRRRAVTVADASVAPTDTPAVDTDRIQIDAAGRIFNWLYSIDESAWFGTELGVQTPTLFYPRVSAVGASAPTIAGGQTVYWDPLEGGANQATTAVCQRKWVDTPPTNVYLRRFEVDVGSNTLDSATTVDWFAPGSSTVYATATIPAGQSGRFEAVIADPLFAGGGNFIVIRAVLGGTGAQALTFAGFSVEVYRA